MFTESPIVTETRKYVEELMSDFSEDLSYHNFQHTSDVVKAAIEIGEKTELNEDQMEMVVLAAWLHDTGYSNGSEDHEKESRNIANNFLSDQEYPWNSADKST